MKLFRYETEEEQLKAVKKNGLAIQYIHNPTKNVIKYIIENYYNKNPEIIQSMKFDYEKLPDDLKMLLKL